MARRTFRVWRGDKDAGEFREYQTEVTDGMVVLDRRARHAEHFADMRAALRQAFIADLISDGSAPKHESQRILRELCNALADVA